MLDSFQLVFNTPADLDARDEALRVFSLCVCSTIFSPSNPVNTPMRKFQFNQAQLDSALGDWALLKGSAPVEGL